MNERSSFTLFEHVDDWKSLSNCVLLSFELKHPLVNNPGKAQWNLDGSWTIDWPMIEEIAEWTVITSMCHNVDFNVLMARALIKARDSGKLIEDQNPDNTIPEN